MNPTTRRTVLGALGGAAALSGCLGGSGGGRSTSATDARTDTAADASGPPTADRSLPSAYTAEELAEAAQSGGPGPDGIPAIERPQFAEASDPPPLLEDGDPVFGVSMGGETKAYPQSVLVWHEIVNDTIGGEPVSVTYCPLTGTAQGFYRGNTTFGVSGQLINTNLVMFDRATESWWPQMLATGITGPHVGETLAEFQAIWTTWGRWRSVHPDTVVLTDDTGYARNYGRDPYGAYNPPSGYYADEGTLFAPLTSDDRLHPKAVVIGMRSADGAAAVSKEALRSAGLLEFSVGGVPHLAVHDAALDTGYVYRLGEADADRVVSETDEEITVDGTVHEPADLPFDRRIAYDAMWMAWYGYYPTTELVR